MICSVLPMPGNPSLPSGTPGRVTREMVYARTRGLAVNAGRPPLQITQADYEQARRELTGETEMTRQEARLDGEWAACIREPGRSASPWAGREPPAGDAGP